MSESDSERTAGPGGAEPGQPPGAEPPGTPTPPSAAPPGAPTPHTASPGTPAPPSAVPPPDVPYWAAQQSGPFAPIPRAPREPWVHPRRRGVFAAIATGVALVCFGGGIGVGIAVAPGGGHEHGRAYLRPYERSGPGGFGQFPRGGQPVRPGTMPTPAPSGTS
jgi:hypothetical protein